MFMNYEGPRMRIKLSGNAGGVCPITEERDFYEWEIRYTPRDKLIEVVSLREKLEKIKDDDHLLTCEGLAIILNKIVKAADPYHSRVTVWDNSDGVHIKAII